MTTLRPNLRPFVPGPRALHALHVVLLGIASCVAPALALAQERQSLPAWEQLSAAERDVLVAPIRERWNAKPGQRAELLHHAQRWQSLTPQQRRHARHGMKRWSHLDPEKRARVRVLFGEMRKMTPEQRDALRTRWKAMTPAERDAWVEAHRQPAATRDR